MIPATSDTFKNVNRMTTKMIHKSKQINFGNIDTNQTVKFSNLLASYLGFLNLLTGWAWFRLVVSPSRVMIQFKKRERNGEENAVIKIYQKAYVVCGI
jgi:hypothetical protein